MKKRLSPPNEESPDTKRRKLLRETSSFDTNFEIKSPEELQALLRFEQDAGDGVLQKVKAFKTFLNSVRSSTQPKASNSNRDNRDILLNFLQRSRSKAGLTNATAFSPLVQSWQFAVQANSEALCSSIAAIFALLLKTISSILDFREHGILLCYELLKDENLTLYDRGLTANKVKEYLIDPCLRLLTEIVRFDGGTAANVVYRQRETTFNRLDVFLAMQRTQDSSNNKEKRSSIRDVAVQFILANLQLQGPAPKTFLLTHTRMIHSFLHPILQDPSRMIHEILRVLRKDVLEDSALSQSIKDRFLNESTLQNLAKLYDYNTETATSSPTSVREAVNSFMLCTCLSLDSGLLRQGRSGEVTSSDMHGKLQADCDNNRKKDGGTGVTRSAKSIKALLGNLRPHADVLQGGLILEVFRLYPPLIHEYHSGKSALSFTPKLSATWVGNSRFLLATIQLPVDVKQLQAMYHNKDGLCQHLASCILPPVLDQKVLTRCLDSPCNFIVFLTIRILNAAFQKLKHIIAKLDLTPSDSASLRMKRELFAEVTSRFPAMQHVVAKFRSCPTGNISMKESITRLLAMYYQITPDFALEQTFDISPEVSDALDTLLGRDTKSSGDAMRHLIFEHLLEIAICSPTMRWWRKSSRSDAQRNSEKSHLSPFTTVLRFFANQSELDEAPHILQGLSSIARQHAIVRSMGQMDALEILVFSLRRAENRDEGEIYEFLDQCIVLVAKKAVIVLEQNPAKDIMSSEVDLLLLALAQQWPFLVQSKPPFVVRGVATWLNTYLRLAARVGSCLTLLSRLHEQIIASMTDEDCRGVLEHSLDLPLDPYTEQELKSVRQSPPLALSDSPKDTAPAEDDDFREDSPPKERPDHTELYSWKREDLHDAAINGLLGDLVLCLSSDDGAIRKASLSNIRLLMQKLEASTYTERQQLYVLLGEVCETAQYTAADAPLPYVASVLAARILLVLTDPLHFMYVKASEFLHRGPRWDVAKLPSYWVNKVVQQEPTLDEEYYSELEWLLQCLTDGLRTPTDMNIYRRSNILERILSISWSSALPLSSAENIVNLLIRCTYVEASTTLISRCGLSSWIASMRHRTKGRLRKRLERLAKRLLGTSDEVRMGEWSDGTLRSMLEELSVGRRPTMMSRKLIEGKGVSMKG